MTNKRTTQAIPAEAGKPCDCCGRMHRKLMLVTGFWMGKTCAEFFQNYQAQAYSRQQAASGNTAYAANIANYWLGREKQLARIQAMTNKGA